MLTIPEIIKRLPSRFSRLNGEPIKLQTFNRWRRRGWWPKADRRVGRSPVWEWSSYQKGIEHLRDRGLIDWQLYEDRRLWLLWACSFGFDTIRSEDEMMPFLEMLKRTGWRDPRNQ